MVTFVAKNSGGVKKKPIVMLLLFFLEIWHEWIPDPILFIKYYLSAILS